MHGCKIKKDTLLVVFESINTINNIYYSVINIKGKYFI